MDLILDTCAFLALGGLTKKKLSKETLKNIATAQVIYISACSMFEIAIKHKKKGLDLGKFANAQVLWNKAVTQYDLTELPVSHNAFFESLQLPDYHSVPFDRIIIG